MIDEKSKAIRIAIIGGTGKEGSGLAYRWVKAGHKVIIGSRNEIKAQNAFLRLKKSIPDVFHTNISYGINTEAVKNCDVAVLTIPYQFHEKVILDMKSHLQGKFFLDVTVPLVPPKVSVVTIPPDGSLAKHAQKLLGEEVKVISAFQNISFELLQSDENIDCEVLVCGTDKESRQMGIKLVEDAGLIAWDAGPLENSIIAEGLTSILIRLNKKYKTHSAGIKITGING